MGKNNRLRNQMPQRRNYRMYKAKKQWITACVTFFMLFGAGALISDNAHAATKNVTNVQEETTNTNSNKNKDKTANADSANTEQQANNQAKTTTTSDQSTANKQADTAQDSSVSSIKVSEQQADSASDTANSNSTSQKKATDSNSDTTTASSQTNSAQSQSQTEKTSTQKTTTKGVDSQNSSDNSTQTTDSQAKQTSANTDTQSTKNNLISDTATTLSATDTSKAAKTDSGSQAGALLTELYSTTPVDTDGSDSDKETPANITKTDTEWLQTVNIVAKSLDTGATQNIQTIIWGFKRTATKNADGTTSYGNWKFYSNLPITTNDNISGIYWDIPIDTTKYPNATISFNQEISNDDGTLAPDGAQMYYDPTGGAVCLTMYQKYTDAVDNMGSGSGEFSTSANTLRYSMINLTDYEYDSADFPKDITDTSYPMPSTVYIQYSNKSTVQYQFVDDDLKGGDAIGPNVGDPITITGEEGETVNTNLTDANIPAGYQMADGYSIPSSVTLNKINPTVQLHLVHKNVSKTYTFVDDDESGKTVSTKTVTGKWGLSTDTGLTIPDGYELASGQTLPTSVTLDKTDNPAVTIRLVHKKQTISNPTTDTTDTDPDTGKTIAEMTDVKRTYSILAKDSSTNATIKKLVNEWTPEFTRAATKDMLTGKYTYGAWTLNSATSNIEQNASGIVHIVPLSNEFDAAIDGYTYTPLSSTTLAQSDVSLGNNGRISTYKDSGDKYWVYLTIYNLSGGTDLAANEAAIGKFTLDELNAALPDTQILTVNYTPQTQNYSYQFVDDDDNGANVGDAITISGKTGDDFTSAEQTALTVPTGYALADGQTLPTAVENETSNAVVKIHLVHATASKKYTFVDDDESGATVSSKTVSGKWGQTIDTGLTVPDGYELASGQTVPTSVTLDKGTNADVTIHLVHKTAQVSSTSDWATYGIASADQVALTKDVTRTIYTTATDYSGGPSADPSRYKTDTQTVSFKRTAIVDEVTKKVIGYVDPTDNTKTLGTDDSSAWQLASSANSWAAYPYVYPDNGYTYMVWEVVNVSDQSAYTNVTTDSNTGEITGLAAETVSATTANQSVNIRLTDHFFNVEVVDQDGNVIGHANTNNTALNGKNKSITAASGVDLSDYYATSVGNTATGTDMPTGFTITLNSDGTYSYTYTGTAAANDAGVYGKTFYIHARKYSTNTVEFEDADNNNQVVATVDMPKGKLNETVSLDSDTLTNAIPANYELASGQTLPTSYTYSSTGSDSPVIVKLAHKAQTITDPTETQQTRQITVKFVNAKTGESMGDLAPDAVLDVYFKRTVTKDLVTGKTSYGE